MAAWIHQAHDIVQLNLFYIMYIKYMMGVFLLQGYYFGEKAAWVHQAHDTEQLNLFYMIIDLPHHEKHTSCT